MSARQRLPNRREAETFSISVGGLQYSATIGRFADGGLAAKLGTDADAMACDSAVLASLLLQHHVPVDLIRRALMRDGRGQARTPLGAVLDILAAELKP
jgi:hypothetical protein